MTINLTPHFTLAELTASTIAATRGLPNAPDDAALANLHTLAVLLERVRAHLGVPITITSGYRSSAVNFAVGGSATSDHLKGLAADIVAPAYGSAHAVASALAPHVSMLGIGQLILEGVRGKQWVHISAKPPANAINRILTITDNGTVSGIVALA